MKKKKRSKQEDYLGALHDLNEAYSSAQIEFTRFRVPCPICGGDTLDKDGNKSWDFKHPPHVVYCLAGGCSEGGVKECNLHAAPEFKYSDEIRNSLLKHLRDKIDQLRGNK